MKPVPRGEPYAGKLHVRFDEGYPSKNGEARFEGSRRPSGRSPRGVPLYSTPSKPKPAYEAYQRLTQHCPPGSMRPRLDDSGEVWTARWRKPDGTSVVATWHPRGDGKVMFRVGE